MSRANTTPIKFYIDVNTMTINNAASIISKTRMQPSKYPHRFVYFTSFQCRQNMPYMTNEGVVRSLYGKEVVVLPIDKIKERAATGRRY